MLQAPAGTAGATTGTATAAADAAARAAGASGAAAAAVSCTHLDVFGDSICGDVILVILFDLDVMLMLMHACL